MHTDHDEISEEGPPSLAGTLALLDEPASDVSSAIAPVEIDVDRLTREERLDKVFDLRMRGAPASTIARVLRVDVSTVYRDLQEYYTRYREQIENQPASNLIAETLAFLDAVETTCMFEYKQAGGEDTELDRATGRVTRIKGDSHMKLGYLGAAMKARDMKTKLLLDTGVIPKEPERLHHALVDARKTETTDEDVRRSPEEIRGDIMNLLQQGRQLPA